METDRHRIIFRDSDAADDEGIHTNKQNITPRQTDNEDVVWIKKNDGVWKTMQWSTYTQCLKSRTERMRVTKAVTYSKTSRESSSTQPYKLSAGNANIQAEHEVKIMKNEQP